MCNMEAGELFEKYADMVYRVALMSCSSDKCMAEDTVQEVFVRYLKNKPAFESEEHAKAWFIRVAVNCTRSQATSAWKRKVVSVEELYDSEEDMPVTFDSEESELFEVLQSLPQKYSIVLYLRYYEEYQVNEIARILHTTEGTISSRLSRARNLLKEELSKEGYIYYGRERHESVAQNV